MVNIKVVHKENNRRFTLPSNATWKELETKLRSLFAIPALTSFSLSYTDEDNDVITLSTDIELQEILSTSPTIKFNLKFSTPDDSSDGEESNNEVWVFEGRNVPSQNDGSSPNDSGLQDNVSQSNVASQEPQFIEIDSRDIKSIKKSPPISFSDDNDDFENVDPLEKKTTLSPVGEDNERVKQIDKITTLSDGDYEVGKSSDKKTSLLDDDYDVGKSLDKKSPLLDEDHDVVESLNTKISLFNEDYDVGKSLNTKTYISDEEYDVEKSLDKKISLLDEDYDVGKSLDKKISLLDEVYDVGKSLNKKTYLLDEDYDVGKSPKRFSPLVEDVSKIEKSFKKTSLFDDEYEVGKSFDKKTSLLDEDYDAGKTLALDQKTSLLDDDDDDETFEFRPNMASFRSRQRPRSRNPPRGKQPQKETGASPQSLFPPLEQQNQSRRRRRQEPNIQTPPVVDFAEQFGKLVDQYGHVIKENDKLSESVNETMEHINRSIPVDIEHWDKRSNSFARNTSQITAIPGAFPKSTPVIWAGRAPPDFQEDTSQNYMEGRGTRSRGGRGGRGGRGKYRNQNNNYHHHNYECLEQKDGTSGGEEESEGLAGREATDLQFVYLEQYEKLSNMGFKEEEYVELLDKYNGELERVLEDLLD